MPLPIWVAELRISPRTREKLSSKHGLDADDVRDAVVCVRGLPYVWDYDDDRGWRAIIQAAVAGQPCLVVLYNVPHPMGDVWNLGSAYPVK